jgi:type IV pilus assembly protein PilB
VRTSTPDAAPEPPALPGFTPPPRAGADSGRIGDVIVALGFASREAVERAVEHARAAGITTGQALLGEGAVTSDQLARAVARRYGVDHVDLDVAQLDPGAAALVDPAVLRRHRTVPVAFADERTLIVATADPANVLAIDDLAMLTGFDIRRAVATAEDVDALLARLSRLGDAVEEVDEPPEAEVIELRDSADDGPVVTLVHSIVAEAVQRGASDIHFDAEADGMRVRFRVDGLVSESTTVQRAMVPKLVSRIKIMANLDISERRRPQDGRVGLAVDGHHIDIRVASLPVVHGESVVMRILDKDKALIGLDQLGLDGDDAGRLRRSIARMHGCVLATGPTGSGKTTTLYAVLNEINTPDRTLITIEDPVEYELPGVKQVQVNRKTALDFATGLRSMMRADPDVLMVGEIRDRETAHTAIEAALTGHLVLSTLHTNSAPLSVARLIDMGIEPFLVAAGVSAVVAQRLARRLCECATEVELAPDVLAHNGFADAAEPLRAREPAGCVRCAHTGYRGRVGIYELMEVDDDVRALIVEKRPAEEIAAAAERAGMRRLRAAGLAKVEAGLTSLPELLRVSGAAS